MVQISANPTEFEETKCSDPRIETEADDMRGISDTKEPMLSYNLDDLTHIFIVMELG